MHEHLLEAETRVEDGQPDRGNGDHHTVQDDKLGFILHDRISPSRAQFRDSVDATGEDGDICDNQVE